MRLSRPAPPYVRQIASELELLSHGATTSFGASGSGVPGSREPSGESKPPHLAFLADWDRNGDSVLERWNELLKGWKGGGKVRPAGVSEREIVLTDGEGFSPDDVAMRYRLTATMVRRWRVQDERDGETGVPLAKVRERVRALRAQDLSYRQIAERLGRSKSQVERVDKERAA
jgi:transposase